MGIDRGQGTPVSSNPLELDNDDYSSTVVGPQGPKGDDGDITPEYTQMYNDTIAAKNTATSKASEASASASNAATSETNANTSANAASASATSASNSASASATSETNAATSESNAASSATAAASSATSASGSASTATTKASEAATSASTATTKASEAATSASSALTYKNAAESAKTAAETAETNAETAETNAASSATSAASSATSASSSASTATTKASEASTSASNAATSETNAATSETNAATSETNAASSATSASTSATSASTSASTATTKASEAATSATNAASSESAASTSATNAANSATAAASSASNASTSETNAASSATSAATSATNAAASESSVATNASNAATSETNAANSATSAATSASTATTKASEAATSASTATTKASEASTSASNAATSATNAATSATNAAASFDSFDDRYLGSKSSEPTVDNDGDALLTGALYFNSTTNTMKVYSGSSWLDAYATLSGALLATNNLSDLNNAATARTNLGLGTAATTASTDYATSAQGTTADNALPKAGGTMTGAITFASGQTFDGRDVSADGTKLDTIATNANNYVHPTFAGDDINVDTGALTGATVVSDIDFNVTTDTNGHVTDANGTVNTRTLTLADLGYTGATNANNYTHPTFNGDDFSVDTGALTGATVVSDIDINVTTDTNGHVTDANGAVATRTLTLADLGYTGETNATADQTASEILTAIKTVDGSGSGLDADTVDGLQASQFLRSDASDVMSGTLTMNHDSGSNSHGIVFRGASGSNGEVGIRAVGESFQIYEPEESNKVWLEIADDPSGNATALKVNSASGMQTVWHAGNDGSGSGLDADTVDGLQASQFLRSDASDSTSGNLTVSGYVSTDQLRNRTGQQLILNAGESQSYATGQTGELVYVNAEGGLQVNTSPDNWASGWAGRDTTTIHGEYVTTPEIRINDTNTKIQEGSTNSVRVQTNSGYVEIGPQNTSWAHFKTDRSQFYFSKKIHAVDEIAVYNDNGTKLNTTGVFDNGNRVYSAANPPPAAATTAVFGGSTEGQFSATNGSVTIPAGTKGLMVTLVGGGGGGGSSVGGGNNSTGSAGSGGGGGGYIDAYIPLNNNTSFTANYSIGGAGRGGSNISTNVSTSGTAGGSTSLTLGNLGTIAGGGGGAGGADPGGNGANATQGSGGTAYSNISGTIGTARAGGSPLNNGNNSLIPWEAGQAVVAPRADFDDYKVIQTGSPYPSNTKYISANNPKSLLAGSFAGYGTQSTGSNSGNYRRNGNDGYLGGGGSGGASNINNLSGTGGDGGGGYLLVRVLT